MAPKHKQQPKAKQAEPRPDPRIYLITPQVSDAEAFAPQLMAALDAADVAAVLLRLADADEGTMIKRAKALAAPVQQRDAALLLDQRSDLVARARADGAHLSGIEAFTEALDALKPDGIAGAGNLHTRHDVMTAAETGADYVMFGEPEADGTRPGFEDIEDRVAWWAEVFELPCIGYAASLDEVAPLVAAGADFVALGDAVWRDPRGAPAALADAMRDLKLPEPVA